MRDCSRPNILLFSNGVYFDREIVYMASDELIAQISNLDDNLNK